MVSVVTVSSSKLGNIGSILTWCWNSLLPLCLEPNFCLQDCRSSIAQVKYQGQTQEFITANLLSIHLTALDIDQSWNIFTREYEPNYFQLPLWVFSPSLTLQVYKTGSWNSNLAGQISHCNSKCYKKLPRAFKMLYKLLKYLLTWSLHANRQQHFKYEFASDWMRWLFKIKAESESWKSQLI